MNGDVVGWGGGLTVTQPWRNERDGPFGKQSSALGFGKGYPAVSLDLQDELMVEQGSNGGREGFGGVVTVLVGQTYPKRVHRR